MDRPPGNLDPGGAGTVTRTRPPQPSQPLQRTQGRVERDGSTAVPVPASGLELLGRFERSGHRDAPSMVRRADGQVIQLTPLLYAVLTSIDGYRRYEQIAAVVGEKTGRLIEPDDIRILVEDKLRPLGLLQGADGSEPVLQRANPLLGLRLRFAITDPRITRAVAAPFAKLFVTPVAIAVTVAFLFLTGWLLFDRGLGPAVREALYRPGLLLLVLALTTLSAGFHELGHAAALVRGGGRPGVIGAGLYLVWPAFYTDVTDAYRLGRRSRLRVDLGGIYFNAIFALLAFVLWAVTGWEALLAVIPLQVLQMARQMIPLVRLDGYHILADLTGVPDLFAHIKPILTGMLPTRWGRAENRTLKPWVRFVVSAWVLLVVPLLLTMLVFMAIVLPRVAATAWDSITIQAAEFTAAWSKGEVAAATVDLLSLAALAIPILSIAYLLVRVARSLWLRVWRSTDGRPVRRGIAILVAVGLIAALISVWWPRGQYTPIQAGERGRIADLAAAVPVLGDQLLVSDSVSGSVAAPQPPSGEAGTAPTDFDSHPEVLAGTDLEEAIPAYDSGFRFTLPEPPGEGDNQALAVNYENGSSVIAMALSLIFAEGDTVTNSNEAYALASCMKCMAAAIAFQLVVIMDQTDVIVPENTAVAVTAYCVRCVTYALAFQLIVTLDEPLSDEAAGELDALWARLESLQERAGEMAFDDLLERLKRIETKIMGILVAEGATLGVASEEEEAVDAEVSPSPTEEPSPTAEPSPSTTEPSPTPTGEPSPTAEPSPTSEPSPSPTAEPSPTDEPSPSTSP